jgi:cell division protein FtsB
MAARAHAASAPARRVRRRPAARRRPGPRLNGSRVQWDRVGRVALSLVLLAVVYSYLNPVIDLVKTYAATGAAKAQLHRTLDENKSLHRRIQNADDPLVLDAKARAGGMVRPGETPYVIRVPGR